MKKINAILFSLIATSLVLLFVVSCKKIENDTQSPKVTILQPANNQSFSTGKQFLVVTIMHDYVSLASYRYRVQWHDDPSNVSENPNDPAWELEESHLIEVDQNLQTISWHIQIPDNIRTGYYKLNIYCYDKAGNVGDNNVLLLITN